jgi:hypothetical protein
MATNSTKAGNFKDIDTVQSTEWSLRCLSHQKNVLTFELENIKTKRVHKMIFKGNGTDEVTKDGNWLQGVYDEKFKTNFPATFENFDETLAMLTPRSDGYNNTHLLRIGWLASVVICQPHKEGFGAWYLYGVCRIEYGSGEGKYSRVQPTTSGGGAGKVSMSDFSF